MRLVQWCDDAGGARAIAAPLAPVPSACFAGLHAPQTIHKLAEMTPVRVDGMATRLVSVVRDNDALAHAWSIADYATLIESGKLVIFAGARALQQLNAELSEYSDEAVGLGVELPDIAPGSLREATRADASALAQLLRQAAGAQQARLSRLQSSTAALYARRDAAYWSARYADALSGRGRPLRVVLPTTRFSTFLRYSVQDLRDALEARGCEVRTLVERSEYSRLTAISYLGMVADFEPDCAILLNYTRGQMRHALPPGLPVVTWVQDAMGHLFDAESGASLGPLDFVLGHYFPDFFRAFRYPGERFILASVVANQRKFFKLATPRTCEVAYVSHHSQTPEALHAGFVEEASRSNVKQLPEIVRRVYEPVRAIATRAVAQGGISHALETATREVLRDVMGGEPDATLSAHVLHAIVRPLGERCIRHQMLAWARDVCKERGWRLHIYGKGWEKTTGFEEYARGIVAHDGALREVYAGAAANLHASLGTYLHQRVMECALSGGVPLVRRKLDDFWFYDDQVARALTLDGVSPCVSTVGDRQTWYHAFDHERVAMLARLRSVLNLEDIPGTHFRSAALANDHARERATLHPREAVELLGDWQETTFDSREGLEALLVKAVERPAWRENVSEGIAARARAALTYDIVVERLLTTMRDGIRASAGEREVAA
jgi:hypothetical protein